MIVLYFHQYFSNDKGKGGLRSFMMSKALLAAGHSVVMVCGRHRQSETGLTSDFVNGKRSGFYQGIQIVELDLPYDNEMSILKRSMVFLKYVYKSIVIVLSYDFDIILASSTPLSVGFLGVLGKVFRRKKFVFEVRDLWPTLPIAMNIITNRGVIFALRFLEWLSYYFADLIIALSDGIKEGIVLNGVSSDKIRVVPNGCDLDIFTNKAHSESIPFVDYQDFVAIYTGTHGRANGLFFLIEVARELKALKQDHIKLVLVGEGKLKKTLIEAAVTEGLQDVILFLPTAEKISLSTYLHRANVGMQILMNIPEFYYGTSPNKFFDYLATGKPIITNYPGWIADEITEKKCGIAVPPENPKLFAESLILMKNNPDQQRLFSENSMHLALTKYNRINLSKEWVACVTSN